MMNMRKFSLTFNILMNAILGFVMTLSVCIMQHNLTLETFLTSYICGFAVGYTVSDIVPAPMVAKKLTANIKNKLLNHLITTFLVAVVFISLISFTNTFIATGFMAFIIWPKTIVLSFIEGYMVLCFMLPIIEKIAFKVASK